MIALLVACDTAGIPNGTATPIAGQTPTLPTVASSPTIEIQPTASTQATPLVTATPGVTKVATAQSTSVTSETASPTATLMSPAERNELFEEVWGTVNDHYLYADFRGVDWNKTHDEYEERINKVGSAAEFYTVMSEMVGLLNDDHSRYLSPEEAKDEDDLNRGDASYAGIGILSKYESSSALVLLVFPDSPAEEAGLQRRDRILAIDGKKIGNDGDVSPIRGPAGTDVRLTVKSPGEEQREVTITRRAVTGKITASSSRLEVDGSIGYLLVPSLWADDMTEQVEERLGELLQGPSLKGLVMDLRANEGGWRPVLTGILGQLVAGDVGHFYSQESDYPMEIDRGNLYDKLKNVPMVVLVDGNSQSYAEVLPAALQVSGRAKVVGTKTAGNTETIYSYNFSDGSRLWVAQEGFKLPDGTNLEGRGVIPDVTIEVDWTQYTLKTDPHVLKAVELLTK
ncbi:MAG TPA: S41 family peptidase [Chloroflexia bacterium]|nr:S41 family peptidase [Chloroflexia bacterium]